MLVSKDIHPENKIYYLGGLVLKAIKESDKEVIDFFELFNSVNKKNELSIHSFILSLDWLFLLGLIKDERGNIKRCF